MSEDMNITVISGANAYKSYRQFLTAVVEEPCIVTDQFPMVAGTILTFVNFSTKEPYGVTKFNTCVQEIVTDKIEDMLGCNIVAAYFSGADCKEDGALTQAYYRIQSRFGDYGRIYVDL